MARFDLLRPVSFLAQRVTQWDELCDRILHKTMCYIDSSLNVSMHGWCGDKLSDCRLSLFCDADFAGCVKTARSTTGVFIAVVGPSTFLPLSAVSNRQTATSHSTPEAELVAGDYGVRMEGLPALTLWEKLLGIPKVPLVLCEDNESCARIIEAFCASRCLPFVQMQPSSCMIPPPAASPAAQLSVTAYTAAP